MAKRKRAAAATAGLKTRPITAFFQRQHRLPTGARAPAAGDEVEEIDDTASTSSSSLSDADDADSVPARRDDVDTRHAAAEEAPSTSERLHQTHLTRLLGRRELGPAPPPPGAQGPTQRSRACHRRRHGRPELEHRLRRWALTRLGPLPLTLRLPEDATRVVRAHRLASHCDEFYTSTLAFDHAGVLLVAGASNGVLAVFDFDEAVHRLLGTDAMMPQPLHSLPSVPASPVPERSPSESTLQPVHIIFTGMEIQRIRWNPMNQDEVACAFATKNEIYVYNLQAFPTTPHVVLKAPSRPSSGYRDLVFVPPHEGAPTLAQGPKQHRRLGGVIAGDIDGVLRMWELRFPLRPQWSVSTGTQPINALVLSYDQRTLLCGTEGGVLSTFDICNLVIPAFGSKPMPQRRAQFRIHEMIRPYLAPDAAHALEQAMHVSATCVGITSIALLPSSATQVVLELRNQWVVVLDFCTGVVSRLHVLSKDTTTGSSNSATIAPSHPASVSIGDRPLSPGQRHTWLHHHRCAGSLFLHGEMLCTGASSDMSLSVVDLRQLDGRSRHADSVLLPRRDSSEFEPLGASRRHPPDYVERLARLPVPMPEQITAVASHPTQHLIACGGADLRIRLLGIQGEPEEAETDEEASPLLS